MKILFVCFANAGRSQVATAHFNSISRHRAASAGTRVDRLLEQRKPATRKVLDATGGPTVIGYMRDRGIDVAGNVRRQLSPEMVEEADRVIVITAKDSWPEYLLNSPKVIFWDIPNAVGMQPGAAAEVYDRVTQRVETLVRDIG
ncbi:MAG TPA: hypothetical protein VGB25_07970 [Candidatus Binatia bacterium]